MSFFILDCNWYIWPFLSFSSDLKDTKFYSTIVVRCVITLILYKLRLEYFWYFYVIYVFYISILLGSGSYVFW